MFETVKNLWVFALGGFLVRGTVELAVALARRLFGRNRLVPWYLVVQSAANLGLAAWCAAFAWRAESLFVRGWAGLVGAAFLWYGWSAVPLLVTALLKSSVMGRPGPTPRASVPILLLAAGMGPFGEGGARLRRIAKGARLYRRKAEGHEVGVSRLIESEGTRPGARGREGEGEGALRLIPFPFRFLVRFWRGVFRQMSETITPVITLTLEDLRRCSPELRARTLSQVSGIVWFWRGVEDDFSTRSEIRRHDESAGSERATTGRIFRLIRWVEGQAGTRFRRSTRRTARVIQACAGPVFLTGELSDEERWKDPGNLRGISRADIGPFFSLGGTADAFYSAAIFMARADARLPKSLFEVSRLLPARGLAPVADAYSRLRWAANDLERYLCLFDAFECLIRLSLFRLWIVPGEEQTAEEFRERVGLLEKPTMGLWLPPLRKAVKKRRSSRGITTAAIVSFWNGKLVDSQKDLIEAANGVGLSVGGEVPRTHLDFLNFLVSLRNETKGHGGISDRDARPLWEKLQETFLHACAQLAPLVLDGAFVAGDAGEFVELRGWRRGCWRRPLVSLEPMFESDCLWRPSLVDPEGYIDLSPYVAGKGMDVLVWNARLSKNRGIQYIEYGTGRLVSLDPLPEEMAREREADESASAGAGEGEIGRGVKEGLPQPDEIDRAGPAELRALLKSYSKARDGVEEKDLRGAREWQARVILVAERLTALEPEKASDVRTLAGAYAGMGRLTAAAEPMTAGEWYGKALAVSEGLAALEPKNATYLRDMSIWCDKLGGLSERSDPGKARLWYEKGRALDERLAALEPENATYLRSLSIAYNKLGGLDARTESGNAREWYAKALTIREKLAEREPENTTYLRDQAISYNLLGDWDARIESGEPREWYGKALATCEKLAALAPEDAKHLEDQSVLYYKLGNLDVRTEPGKAREWYEKALAVCEGLAAREPENKKYLKDQSVLCEKLGELDIRSDSGKARVWYVRGLAMRERLAATEPENAAYLRELAVSYSNLGRLDEASEPGGAREWYVKGLAIRERLVAAEPENTAFMKDLSRLYNTLSRLDGQSDPHNAREWHVKGLAIRERLAATEPKNAAYLCDLALSYSNLGYLDEQSAPGSAREWYVKGVAIRERLAATEPENGAYLRDLALSYNDLGCLDEQSAPGSAREWYVKGLEIAERLAAMEPENTTYLQDLSDATNRLKELDARFNVDKARQ